MNETITGTGTLTAGQSQYPCTFRLDIYEDRRMKSGSGYLSATADALWAGFDSDRCRIVMEDGRSFGIVINSYSPGDGDAAFKMSGPISDPPD